MKKSKLKLKYEALLKERDELLTDIEVLVKEPVKSEKVRFIKIRYNIRFNLRDNMIDCMMQGTRAEFQMLDGFVTAKAAESKDGKV